MDDAFWIPEFDGLSELEVVVAKARVSLTLTDADVGVIERAMAAGSIDNPDREMLRLLAVTVAVSADYTIRMYPQRCKQIGRYLDVLVTLVSFESGPRSSGLPIGSTFHRLFHGLDIL